METEQSKNAYVYVGAGGGGGAGSTFGAMHINPPKRKTVFNPNLNAAFSIPLSELVNLWHTKFGGTWVDVSELEEAFWVDASMRLHQNKKMETLDHPTSNTPWSRLKEDA